MEGLNAGADYYLTKPFDSRELLACINALLRRQGGQVDEPPPWIWPPECWSAATSRCGCRAGSLT